MPYAELVMGLQSVWPVVWPDKQLVDLLIVVLFLCWSVPALGATCCARNWWNTPTSFPGRVS